MMIALEDWKAMKGKDQTLWLELSLPANKISMAARKLRYGIGVNDAHYITNPKIGGKTAMCPAYVAWMNMLNRAYSGKLHSKHQTYIGVSVCSEWSSFMEFRKWWLEHQVDSWHLDKDILSDSREYSPSTSIYIPKWLNLFIIDSGAARGELPIGANYDHGRIMAQCSNPVTGRRESLGCFDSKESAYIAWLTRKLELALELKQRMDEIDSRIYPRIVEIIRSAK